MRFNWIDWLGDWNPQLLRELKGRLNPRNVVLAVAISLLGQLLLLLSFQTQLPIRREVRMVTYNRYCSDGYGGYGKCLLDSLGNMAINWQMWWQDVFAWMSLMGIFALLVAGTYLLISDLAHEERRDTLNFIRLSPHSPQSILVGKLLGVPILLYLAAGLAIPLHLWAGMAAGLSLGAIFSLYVLALASCLFFYSAALLLGLVSSWLGGFQAWLGSGAVFICLWSAAIKPISHTPADWLNLFSPTLFLQHAIAASRGGSYSYFFSYVETDKLQWFFLPVGTSTVNLLGFALLNYALWTYWCWQALRRRFPNPSKTVLSKSQSYLLVACFEVILLGFAATTPKWPYSSELSTNYNIALVCNLLLFLGLIVGLTPPRQAMQDWARYRREQLTSPKRFWSENLWRDLIWGEKSPALLAIALNAAIVATMLVPWIAFHLQPIDKLPACLSLVIGLNLILIYAAVAQLLAFMRTQKQALWVTGMVSASILLPPSILSLLSLTPYKAPALWLFTPFAWAAIEKASATSIFLSVLAQWGVLVLSTLQVSRQLKRAGESGSKALFAAQPALKG